MERLWFLEKSLRSTIRLGPLITFKHYLVAVCGQFRYLQHSLECRAQFSFVMTKRKDTKSCWQTVSHSFYLDSWICSLAPSMPKKLWLNGKVKYHSDFGLQPKYTVNIKVNGHLSYFRTIYFQNRSRPFISSLNLTVQFQRTAKRATRTIINGDAAFTLHVYPDGFWW